MMQTKSEKIGFIKDESLSPFSVAISLKSDAVNNGDMSYNNDENDKNRNLLFKELGIQNKNHIRNRQIHSDKIVRPDCNNIIEADGLISADIRDSLMLFTADCYNIFFTTDSGREFGAVHAGWKGIAGGIIGKMKELLTGKTKILIAQGICGEHFTVKDDVAFEFERNFSSVYVKRERNITVDLRSIINDELRNSGELFNLNLCNVCNKDKLFSFRENDEKQRNLSIIWRDDE